MKTPKEANTTRGRRLKKGSNVLMKRRDSNFINQWKKSLQTMFIAKILTTLNKSPRTLQSINLGRNSMKRGRTIHLPKKIPSIKAGNINNLITVGATKSKVICDILLKEGLPRNKISLTWSITKREEVLKLRNKTRP